MSSISLPTAVELNAVAVRVLKVGAGRQRREEEAGGGAERRRPAARRWDEVEEGFGGWRFIIYSIIEGRNLERSFKIQRSKM
jgi:hypothetical protein